MKSLKRFRQKNTRTARGGQSFSDKSLAHTRWNCKYHLVFTLKYRRKVIYGQLRRDIGKILRKLCEMKEVEIIEAHAMPDHIHMLVRIPPKLSVSGFMGFLKGRSAVIIHERHANLKYNYGNRSFWSKGYYVSTVGLNQKTIAKYIREQEAEDRVRDSINKREYKDPFRK
ncbi:IS200/IS605 family transposase [Enterococcus faecalis]|uniref:IS200/IS605 family transposase n=1 Tax=Enterococcus faecalis TaxID=1351 RepID=UPI0020A812D9|nr:IS200/IS605 family transposase [Enterococcus faecalis]